jgi:hypothetical protein
VGHRVLVAEVKLVRVVFECLQGFGLSGLVIAMDEPDLTAGLQLFGIGNSQAVSLPEPLLIGEIVLAVRVSSEGWRIQWESTLPGQESEPGSLDSREAGNQILEAYRQSHPWDGERVVGP